MFAQMQSDIIGRPLGVLAEPECTALGAAILGAVGAGCFGSIEETTSAMVSVDRYIEPDSRRLEVYSELHALFRQSYERMAASGIYEDIYSYQASNF